MSTASLQLPKITRAQQARWSRLHLRWFHFVLVDDVALQLQLRLRIHGRITQTNKSRSRIIGHPPTRLQFVGLRLCWKNL